MFTARTSRAAKPSVGHLLPGGSHIVLVIAFILTYNGTLTSTLTPPLNRWKRLNDVIYRSPSHTWIRAFQGPVAAKAKGKVTLDESKLRT